MNEHIPHFKNPYHIKSSTEKYNNLADFIVALYCETYPDDEYWSTMTLTQMIETMAESAKYEAMYNELLTSNLKENQERTQNLFQSIMLATNLMTQAEADEDYEKRESLAGALGILENFKELEEKGRIKPKIPRKHPANELPLNSDEEF